MKLCGDCGRELPLEQFNKNKTKKDGLQTKCRECSKKYYKNYYEANPKEKARLYSNSDEVAKAIRKELQDIKGSTPCVDCKKQYPYYVMQFDHIASDKEFTISQFGKRSRKKVMAEVAKCEVVCANCHAERTYSRLV